MAQGERVLPLWICLSGVCRLCYPMWLGRTPIPSAPSTTPGASAPHLPRNRPVKWHPHKCQAQCRMCDLGQQLVQTGLCMTPPMGWAHPAACQQLLPASSAHLRADNLPFLWDQSKRLPGEVIPSDAAAVCLLLPSSLTPSLLSASPLC